MEWQPIATAPKDGESVLVVDHDAMFVAWYDQGCGEWTDGDRFSKTVTHWMPLPDLPKEQS